MQPILNFFNIISKDPAVKWMCIGLLMMGAALILGSEVSGQSVVLFAAIIGGSLVVGEVVAFAAARGFLKYITNHENVTSLCDALYMMKMAEFTANIKADKHKQTIEGDSRIKELLETLNKKNKTSESNG